MTRRLARYVLLAYPPSVQLPFMVSWAVGLTALFVCAGGDVTRFRAGPGLAVTTVTLVVDMLLLRAMDDIRDHDYDRAHNPSRPLPAGVVRESDLVALVGAGGAALLLLNAGRGIAEAALAGQLGYTALVIAADRLAGWPPGDRLGLHLAVNLPIQPLLSLYVYAGFLRAYHERVTPAGLTAILAVTFGGLCLELGRKATRAPRPGERTYATVLGPAGTSAAALASATAATTLALALLRPWQPGTPGQAWGWLVLLPLGLPAAAAVRFAAGTPRWPAPLVRAYVPVMYAGFLAVGWLTKGGAW